MKAPLRYVADMNRLVLPESTPPDWQFKYIDISQVSSLGEISIPNESTTFESAPSRARRIAVAGDTIVSTVRTYLRAIATVPDVHDHLIFSTGFAVLSPRGVEPRFLGYACRSSQFVHEVVGRSVGVSYPAIAPSDLLDIPIWTPDLEEQRRIADFLDDRVSRIDRIIAARREQMGMAADVLKAKVSKACVDGDLAPLRRLVSSVQTGGTPSEAADSAGGLPWYSPTSFEGNLRIGAPVRRIYPTAGVRFEAGSVLLVAIGATAGKVAWLDHDASGNQQLTCIKTRPERMDGRFLLHQLNARSDELRQSAPASTLPILNNEAVRSFDVWAPEMNTQVQLAAEWDQLLTHSAAGTRHLQASIDLLTEYKSSLITAAVTGELDVSTAGSSIPG